MAIITRKELKEKIQNGDLIIEPNVDAFQLQPSAIDLRLGWSFYIPEAWECTDQGRVAIRADYVDSATKKNYFKLIKLKPGQFFELLPHEFVIISTLEKITIAADNLIGMLQPRSSTLRRGVLLEGGKVDTKYNGHLIIPITNVTNHIVKLYPGERLCQLVIQELNSPLSPEEAMQHGSQLAKYQDATPYGLAYRSDSKEETDLILQGKIDELKNQHKI